MPRDNEWRMAELARREEAKERMKMARAKERAEEKQKREEERAQRKGNFIACFIILINFKLCTFP